MMRQSAGGGKFWMPFDSGSPSKLAAEQLRDEHQAMHQAQYDSIVASPLRYVIDVNRIGMHYDNFQIGYIAHLAELTQKVADEYAGNMSSKTEFSEGDEAMSYLLLVADLNLSSKYRQEWFKWLGIDRTKNC